MTFRLKSNFELLLSLCLVLVCGCTGVIGDGPARTLPDGAVVLEDGGVLQPDGGTGGGSGEVDAGTHVFALAGVRRLSQREATTAAAALLGLAAPTIAESLGSDVRQAGYTRNADARVGAVQADALWSAVQALAHQAVTTRLAALAPCTTVDGSEPCAQRFIHDFAARAFRRVPAAAEETALLEVYRSGRTDGTWATGLELVIQAVLQSGSFLYVTELGDSASGDTIQLTGDELATSLALLLTGAPADDALVAQGRSGELASATTREAVAKRLLATSAGRSQVQRLVLEWVGADAVDVASKDATLFPGWAGVRADVLAESQAIINSALFDGDGRLPTLLLSDTAVATPAYATFYNVTAGDPKQPGYRKGLLLSAAFTSANAHPAATSPVKRGAVVRKKLLCQELPLPTNVGVIMVPAPDPTRTTRERFASHSANSACSGCHSLLDPIGFALESFDAAGRYRTTENGKPIDPSGELLNAGEASKPFANGVELAQLLATSTDVERCFHRQVYRFASGRSGGDEEQTFVDFVQSQPAQTVPGLLVAWVRSESFMMRRLK